jgi:uncharacterized damage-inducible protein DinB
MIVETRSELLTAVEKTALRLSLLLRAATKPHKNALGVWSVAETANHLSHCYPAFADVFRGTFSADIDDIDERNIEVVAQDPERDLDALAHRIEAGAGEYTEVAASFDEHELLAFFTGMKVPAAAVTAILLGEALVHGYDIARAESLPWAIEPAHALLTMQGLIPVMGHFVDAEAAAGLNAAFEIRLRGGPRTYWYFDDGRLTVEESQVRPVDCRLSAEPVTFMLMSYNRIGPTVPVLSGKVAVWGRRPWLATRLGGLFKT